MPGRWTGPNAPLELTLDMPGGELPVDVRSPAQAAEIVIPPLPSLVHDAAFFTRLMGGGSMAGCLTASQSSTLSAKPAPLATTDEHSQSGLRTSINSIS